MDDVRQVVHVEPAGGHVRGHEQLQVALAELLHDDVTLLLREFAVEGVGVIAVLDELVGDFLRLLARAAEDDAIDLRIKVHDAFQGEIFILGVDHVVHVVHVLVSFILHADGDFLRVMQVIFGNAGYLRAHRGREEKRVAVFRHIGQDGVDAVGKSHVEHLVGLVHDHIAYGGKGDHATLHEVNQASRRSDHDVHAVFQATYLACDGRTSIDGLHTQAVDIFRIISEVACYLEAELTGGTQDKCLGHSVFHYNLLDKRQTKCGCFTSSGLG